MQAIQFITLEIDLSKRYVSIFDCYIAWSGNQEAKQVKQIKF